MPYLFFLSSSYDELVNRSRDQSVSDYSKLLLNFFDNLYSTECGFDRFLCLSVVMFFRFVTAGEIKTRAEFFEPFITGLSNTTVDQVCALTYLALYSSHLAICKSLTLFDHSFARHQLNRWGKRVTIFT